MAIVNIKDNKDKYAFLALKGNVMGIRGRNDLTTGHDDGIYGGIVLVFSKDGRSAFKAHVDPTIKNYVFDNEKDQILSVEPNKGGEGDDYKFVKNYNARGTGYEGQVGFEKTNTNGDWLSSVVEMVQGYVSWGYMDDLVEGQDKLSERIGAMLKDELAFKPTEKAPDPKQEPETPETKSAESKTPEA